MGWKNRQAGLSLVEMLLSLSMISSSLMAVTHMLVQVAFNTQYALQRSMAIAVADSVSEHLRFANSDDAGLVPGGPSMTDHQKRFAADGVTEVTVGGVYKASWTVIQDPVDAKLRNIELRVEWNDSGSRPHVLKFTSFRFID